MSVKKKAVPSMQSFIDKGADVKATNRYLDFRNILIRIPVGILNELDHAIQKKPWLNRTQWIVEAIHEKLISDNDHGGGVQ